MVSCLSVGEKQVQQGPLKDGPHDCKASDVQDSTLFPAPVQRRVADKVVVWAVKSQTE
jgi:hypothetical protein